MGTESRDALRKATPTCNESSLRALKMAACVSVGSDVFMSSKFVI